MGACERRPGAQRKGVTVRILIADSVGTYGRTSSVIDRFADRLVELTGVSTQVRVQWPEPDDAHRRRSRTWETASAAGAADLDRLVRLHPSDPLILVGCCCGCRVIHDWMDAHPESLDRVAAAGLIADPFRPRDRWLDGLPDPGGQGVSGKSVSPIPDRTFWVSVPGDPLSGVERDSLLRGAVRRSSLTPDQVYRDLLNDLPDSRVRLASRLHLFDDPNQWPASFRRRVDGARAALLRYGRDDRQEQYNAPDGDALSPLDRLAGAIAAEVVEHSRYGLPETPETPETGGSIAWFADTACA